MKKYVDTIYLFRYNNFCTAEEHKKPKAMPQRFLKRESFPTGNRRESSSENSRCFYFVKNTWRGIEVVITRRSWKPFVRKGAWVRIPPSPLETAGPCSDNRICGWWFSPLGEVPKRPKGHPWKGCRSLIAARGFKSLLLRLVPEGTVKLRTEAASEKWSKKYLDK